MRKVTINVTNEDLQRATELSALVGRQSNRTEVIRRALHLLYWAFVTKGATELVAKKNGREVGRLEWADAPMKSRSPSPAPTKGKP